MICTRLCFSCFRMSPGRPQLCAYCGRSWGGRLCQKGHVSPPDAAFCSTCGSTNFFSASPGVSIWLQLVFWIPAGAVAVYFATSYFPVVLTNLFKLARYGIIFLVPIFCLILMFPAGTRKWLLRGLVILLMLVWTAIRGIFRIFFGSPQPKRR